MFGKMAIPDAEAAVLPSYVLVQRLVESGVSRLSAERIVEVQRDAAEPGRARRHAQSHR